mgnify:CR=1 FL=1
MHSGRIRKDTGKEMSEQAEFVNDIAYEGSLVHILRYREEKDGEITEVQWISDFMKQLYDYYYPKKNGIEKKQKCEYFIFCKKFIGV